MPEREKIEIGFKNKNIAIWAKTGRLSDDVVENTLDQIGAYLTSQTQKTFKDQGRGEIKWLVRTVPNIGGVLRDLAISANIKARRWRSKPALIDTGRLKQSITWQSYPTAHKVVVGTMTHYGDKMQLGLPETIKVTDQMKKNLIKYLKRTEKKGGVVVKKKGKTIKLAGKEDVATLSYLLNRKRVTIKPRARPFVFITNIDANRISKIMEDNLRK